MTAFTIPPLMIPCDSDEQPGHVSEPVVPHAPTNSLNRPRLTRRPALDLGPGASLTDIPGVVPGREVSAEQAMSPILSSVSSLVQTMWEEVVQETREEDDANYNLDTSEADRPDHFPEEGRVCLSFSNAEGTTSRLLDLIDRLSNSSSSEDEGDEAPLYSGANVPELQVTRLNASNSTLTMSTQT